MRAEARDRLGKAVKKGKVGRIRYDYTDAEVKDMLAIMDSKKFKNWPERKATMKRRGIDPPGRTYALTTLLVIARERGLV